MTLIKNENDVGLCVLGKDPRLLCICVCMCVYAYVCIRLVCFLRGAAALSFSLGTLSTLLAKHTVS